VDIQADPIGFAYTLLIYFLISFPTDIYLLNKAHEKGEENQAEAFLEEEAD